MLTYVYKSSIETVRGKYHFKSESPSPRKAHFRVRVHQNVESAPCLVLYVHFLLKLKWWTWIKLYSRKYLREKIGNKILLWIVRHIYKWSNINSLLILIFYLIWVIKRSFENFKAYSTLSGECQKIFTNWWKRSNFFSPIRIFFHQNRSIGEKKRCSYIHTLTWIIKSIRTVQFSS
jgi:hypothetical protein